MRQQHLATASESEWRQVVREGRWSRERDGDLPRFCDSSNVGQNARLRATLPASPPAQHIPGSCSLACPPGEGEGHDHAVVPPQPTEGRDHGLFKDKLLVSGNSSLTPVLASFMRNLVSLTEKISIFGGLGQNRFYGGF
jgi:hypothetical protein